MRYSLIVDRRGAGARSTFVTSGELGHVIAVLCDLFDRDLIQHGAVEPLYGVAPVVEADGLALLTSVGRS